MPFVGWFYYYEPIWSVISLFESNIHVSITNFIECQQVTSIDPHAGYNNASSYWTFTMCQALFWQLYVNYFIYSSLKTLWDRYCYSPILQVKQQLQRELKWFILEPQLASEKTKIKPRSSGFREYTSRIYVIPPLIKKNHISYYQCIKTKDGLVDF